MCYCLAQILVSEAAVSYQENLKKQIDELLAECFSTTETSGPRIVVGVSINKLVIDGRGKKIRRSTRTRKLRSQ